MLLLPVNIMVMNISDLTLKNDCHENNLYSLVKLSSSFICQKLKYLEIKLQ